MLARLCQYRPQRSWVAAAASCLVVATPLSAAWIEPANGWDEEYQASSGFLPDSGNTDPTWTRTNYTQTNIITDATTSEPTLLQNRSSNNNPRFDRRRFGKQGRHS